MLIIRFKTKISKLNISGRQQITWVWRPLNDCDLYYHFGNHSLFAPPRLALGVKFPQCAAKGYARWSPILPGDRHIFWTERTARISRNNRKTAASAISLYHYVLNVGIYNTQQKDECAWRVDNTRLLTAYFNIILYRYVFQYA